MPNAHGFIVEGQTVQYDYNYLANKPGPELPSRNNGDAGKVLTVKNSQGTVGWEEISAGMDAAVYDPADAVAAAGGIAAYVVANAQGSLTFDNAPTQNSSNPVTSDGIYTAIQALVQQISALASRVTALEQGGEQGSGGEQESGGASVENNMLSISGASVNDNILVLDGAGAEVDDHMINF